MKKQKQIYLHIMFIIISLIIMSCDDDMKVGTLSVDMKYVDKKQETTVGFSGEFGDFYFSKSSLPIEFLIEKTEEEEGNSVKELDDLVKISVYDQMVVSGDSELAESMKNDTILVKAVEIDKHTGKLIVHKDNNVLPGTYHFDVRLNNVSGSTVIKDALILKMNGHTMKYFSIDLGGKPEINYLGSEPNQIVFKVLKYNPETKVFDKLSTVDHLYLKRNHFEGNNHAFIKNDTPEGGEVWDVKFPITFDGGFYDIVDGGYVYKGQAEIDFGLPGNYEVKIFVK